MTYKLTIRRGSKVERLTFGGLDEAMEALERRAEGARREGRLPAVRMLRDFEPADRVAARLELSTGGMFRRRTAGIDVMGDGSLVAFSGGVGREELKPHGRESGFDAVKRAVEP